MIKANTIINAIKLGISQNPTVITLEITEKKIIEGCCEEVKSEHDITAVMYFAENQQSTKVYIDKQGEVKENMKWKLICGPEFDMTVNKDRLMSFKHPVSGVKFRISNTYSIIVENTICGYEVELVEVS